MPNETQYTITLTRADNPQAFTALKELPVWVREAFGLRVPMPNVVWHHTATASQFWGLSRLAGQLEGVAANAGNHAAVADLRALRAVLNDAANTALTGKS